MRHFHSYGPVDPHLHFCAARSALVEQCVEQLVGDPASAGGRYFTLWAPRQTGKTWLMREAMARVRERFGDRFTVGSISMQGVVLDEDAPADAFLSRVPRLFDRAFHVDVPALRAWEEWTDLFRAGRGVFDRPVILLIDEFDSLPRTVIDRLVGLFRDMFLDRANYVLHGLALIGVRAVLGLESDRGSPFNIQRSLRVPNLSADEVTGMFDDYRRESGQVVDPAVPAKVFEVTRGQPGLVGWLGELLTEKYNPGAGAPITLEDWERVYSRARLAEPNNTLLNLLKKAHGPHESQVRQLFTNPNVPFVLGQDWCSYLYMHGIIDEALAPSAAGPATLVCRFSSPFVQLYLYDALTEDMFGSRGPLLAIEPGDDLDDVFTPEGLCVPPLLAHYKKYLQRLAARGINPWQGQPRRQDQHLTEAVGHFHLYAWLRDAVGRRCTISPEFPTGNGKVDLVLRWQEHTGVIEVKSFIDPYELRQGHAQAAAYAKKLGLKTATLAVFVPVLDEVVLEKLSEDLVVDGVRVVVVAIGWV